MSRYEEAMAFLLGPCVNLYTNAERSAQPCPACGAAQGRPCQRYDGSKTTAPHEERRNLLTPRSEEELLKILEKLARKYAQSHNPMADFGPRRYPR